MPQFITDTNYTDIIGEGGGGLSALQVRNAIRAGAGFINAADFGVVGNGTVDDIIALQAAVDYAAYDVTAPSKIVLIPANFTCKISGTLHLGYGDSSFGNNGYSTVVLYSPSTASYDANFKGAKIIPTFDNAPAINIQGGLRSAVIGIYIEGKNKVLEGYEYPRMITESWYTRYSDNGGADGRMTSPANVVDGTRRGHMGITIDYASASVADATEPWPVAPPYGYGKQKSSGIKILDNTIKFFVTAICCHPSDTAAGSGDSNGDFLEIRGNIIKQNKYSISVGNTQSRLVNIIDNQIDYFWKGIVTGIHGRQKGRVNYVALNHFSGNQIFDLIDLSINGPCKVVSNKTESAIKIGRFNGGGSSAAAPVLDSNDFDLGHIDAATLQTDYILEADNITFIGGKIESTSLAMLIRGEAIFENTTLRPVTDANQFNGVGFDWNTTNDGVFTMAFNNHPVSIYGGGMAIYKEGTVAIIEGKTFGGYRYDLYNQVNNGRKYPTSKSIPGISGRLNDYMWRSKSRGLGELTNRSLSGIRYRFTLPSGALGNPLQESLVQPGTILEISMPGNKYVTALITERTGNNCVSTLLNNWTGRDKDADGNTIAGGYYVDFDATLITTSVNSTNFFWFNTGYASKGAEAVSGTINATSSNVIDSITFDTDAEGTRSITTDANLYNGLICHFYAYSGTPENPTSKMFAGKILSSTSNSVTLEASTMTGTLAAGTTVALFNKNPNEV
jgi:hypothetical protein